MLSLALALSSVAFALILDLSLAAFVKFLLWVVLVDCIGVGAVVATLLWTLANNFLRKVKDEDVEWGFAFDVHLNAFFPVLILLHVATPALFHIAINHPFFLSRFLGNSIWFIACSYYLYITFLGYTGTFLLPSSYPPLLL